MVCSDSVEFVVVSLNEESRCPHTVVMGELYLLNMCTKTDCEIFSLAN